MLNDAPVEIPTVIPGIIAGGGGAAASGGPAVTSVGRNRVERSAPRSTGGRRARGRGRRRSRPARRPPPPLRRSWIALLILLTGYRRLRAVYRSRRGARQ